MLTNARNDILEVFANATGDRVVARWMCSGLNNGMFGLPADGRPVRFSGIAIWRVESGRLAECWIERAGLEAFKDLAGA
ncbi:SnoaL-like polyketide cyclase [Chelatococcus asaccharovorans]|uniref:SnoaL-like polyketide cyclase n=1 Tax=Chelatococcus asaccharovorans TaxID=28210 RepID=A0A2V3U4U2_9HYPH|nr:ester cyclase [Chelatococcus asaccharovorans]PXW57282.1 SnoaL-like polyketide cyclase [Chelatococcus asaccharovorans]